MVLHLLNIIGPRASVFEPWQSHVTVNAMLSALELENDITVLQSLLLIVHPLLQNEPDECLSAVRKRAVHLNQSELTIQVLLVDLASDEVCANALLECGVTGICLQNVAGSVLSSTFIKLFTQKYPPSIPPDGDNDPRATELRMIESNMDLALLPRANAIAGGFSIVWQRVLF